MLIYLLIALIWFIFTLIETNKAMKEENLHSLIFDILTFIICAVLALIWPVHLLYIVFNSGIRR